jgi:tRNA A58 N-methylase Trm61
MVPANVAVFEKTQNFWIAKSLGVACELNLADHIGENSKSIDLLAKETNTHAPSLYRLMRALASDGIFSESQPGVFVNTSLSKALMEGEAGMKYMIQHQMNNTNWDVVNEMVYTIKTGKSSAVKLLGADIFEHLKKSPEKNELYNKAMTNTSDISSSAIVSAYDFSGFKKLADIGGGEGYLLSVILSKYPNMHGIVLDLPHVVEAASENFKKFGVEGRAKVLTGDFFDSIPVEADVYIMKNIVHAFDDPTNIQIFNRLKEKMEPKARLLIFDTVIGQDNKPAFGKIFDLQMLVGTTGGRERTRIEFENLLKQAGFRLNRVIDTASPFSIVEASLAG